MDDFAAEFDALPSASEPATTPDIINSKHLGVTLAGSRKEVIVQLAPDVDPEGINIGSYAIVEGKTGAFLCMVSDVRPASDPDKVRRIPKKDAIPAARVKGMLTSGGMWTDLVLNAHLLRPTGEDNFGPVRNVPAQLRRTRTATQPEINAVFGDVEEPGFFHVGAPLDMPDLRLAINLRRLAQRSVGLFGKSGTGKTFLSRLLLAGIIRENVAVNLIFDMHNEYGWQGDSEDGHKVKGLKQLFPGQVTIFTMDDESSRRRGSNPDVVVTIGMDTVEPEDIEAMQSALDINDAQVGAVYTLARRLGKAWLSKFMDDSFIDTYGMTATDDAYILEGIGGMKGLAEDIGQPIQTVAALRRRFERLRRYGFLKPTAQADVIEKLMRYLDAGQSVVLEFGRYGNSLDAYMFVANFLTRRIHARYVERKEAAFGGHASDPTPLMIVIEEAHKFLDPAVVHHTIFGTIARELRKYNVTLFVIDQRPSQIDREIMSQIATRVTALLTESNDIAAVLDGVSGADGLRDVLARLDTRQQALVLGHAVPIPVVVQTRTYDADFYRSMGYRTEAEIVARASVNVAKMRGPAGFAGFD